MKKQQSYQGRLGLVIIGGLASLMVGFTLTPAFAGIVASIQNSTNTASSGTLTMEEKSGALSCSSFNGGTNSATCATINKYGGTDTPLTPGGAAKTTEITIQNTGNLAATTFSLTPGACSSTNVGANSGTGNLCEKVKVKITSGTHIIFDGTAKALADGGNINLLTQLGGIASITANQTVPFKFEVSLPADTDATFQGKQISQPLTWQFEA